MDGDATLERYWSIYDADPADVPGIVAACFTPGARFESTSLTAPLVGHSAITARVLAIADVVREARVTRGPVVWSDRTARWAWSWSSAAGDAAGTDVAHLADDGRIDRLAVVADR